VALCCLLDERFWFDIASPSSGKDSCGGEPPSVGFTGFYEWFFGWSAIVVLVIAAMGYSL
jgi:hypothetical protein